MSYTRSYSGSVHYSGSEVVSYPASEHGGTKVVHYSGDVPVYMNITVDTDSFDYSVSGTKTALGVVTGTVAATQAAQIAQINASAEQISDATIRGFYHVISSELSAQVSESSSAMKSCVGLLTQEAQDVDRIHGQMDSDYSAIKARYLRIFHRLDKELERRITELDKPAFELGTQGMQDVVQSPYDMHAATVFVQCEDAHSMPLKLTCGRSKGRVSAALQNLKRMCGYLFQYDQNVKNIMDESSDDAQEYIPVVYTLQNDLDTSRQRIVVHESKGISTSSIKRNVISFVATSQESLWQEPVDADQTLLDQSLEQLVSEYACQTDESTSGLDRERVCKQIMDLYRQSQIKTIYNN